MSAVMVLMPKVIKCIMDGLLPISERAKEVMHSRQRAIEVAANRDEDDE